MGELVTLTASDGHQLSAYQAGSPTAKASIVIIQEIFGVNAHIRSVVDLYADLGYLAVAPAMFDRIERGIDFEYTPEFAAIGLELRGQISWDAAIDDVGTAVESVRRDAKVGTVGFCFGGSVSWVAASGLDLDAAVCYYGGQIHEFIDRAPNCPTLLHFGELDYQISADDIADIRAAHPDVESHIYEGGEHGFNCDVRASYNPEASALAQSRTTPFLASHLGMN